MKLILEDAGKQFNIKLNEIHDEIKKKIPDEQDEHKKKVVLDSLHH